MVEVFKTNVIHKEEANMLIGLIHRAFAEYRANFDLDDCDSILRIKSISGTVRHACLITLLNDYGFNAEVLPDIIMRTQQN